MFNYHTSPKDKLKTKDCSLVQVMLSGYRKPSSQTINSYLNWGIRQGILFHMDYYRTITRYLFMSKRARALWLEEIATLLTRPLLKARTEGVVIHTDTPFAKASVLNLERVAETLKSSGAPDAGLSEFWVMKWVTEMFTSTMYDNVEVQALARAAFEPGLSVIQFLNKMEEISCRAFVNDLAKILDGKKVLGKLFIENTTKNQEGNSLFSKFESIISFVKDMNKPWLKVCYDDEHAFAAGWSSLVAGEFDISDYPEIGLVHLNPIPFEVVRGSRLDRHSDTTIYEGQLTPDSYKSLVNRLNELGVLHVREVTPETREREICQLKQH